MLTISVILITYNRSTKLRQCLFSLLKQSYPKDFYEIIVIDDGSEDNTGRVVNYFVGKENIRYFKINHGGCGSARNEGIKKSKNEIITFVADDYIFENGWIESINNFFQNNDAAMVTRSVVRNRYKNLMSLIDEFYADVSLKVRISLSGNSVIDIVRGLFHSRKKSITAKSFYLPASGCAAYRRQVFKVVGFFEKRLACGEDTEMGLRLAMHNIPIYLNDSVIFHDKKINFKTLVNQFINYGYWTSIVKKINPYYPFFNIRGIQGIANIFIYLIFYPLIKSMYARSIVDFILCTPFMYIINILFFIGLIKGLYESRDVLNECER